MPYDVPRNTATPVRGSIRGGAAISRPIDFQFQGGGGSAQVGPSLGYLVIVGGVVVLRAPFGSPVPPYVQESIDQPFVDPAIPNFIDSVRVDSSPAGKLTITWSEDLDLMVAQSVTVQVVSNTLSETIVMDTVIGPNKITGVFSKDPGPNGMYYLTGLDGVTFADASHPFGYLAARYSYIVVP